MRYRGRYLYDRRQPRERADKRARNATPAAGSLVVVPSPLLGYGVDTLLTQLPENCHILLMEAEPALAELFDREGRAALSDPLARGTRLSIVPEPTVSAALAELERIGPDRFRRAVEVALSGGAALHRERYRHILDALSEALRTHWQNRMTIIAMMRRWLSNLFTNLPAVPAGAVTDLRIRGPVAVVAAGPSLDAAIPFLRAERARLTLLAVDTAYPALRAHGLEPDLLCVVESQHHNLDDFVPGYRENTLLLADLSADPGVIQRFRRRLFFTSRFADVDLLRRLEAAALLPAPIPPLGSVGVVAARLALTATDGPVLLAGLDFGFRGGLSHARGTPALLRDLRGCGRVRPVGQLPAEAVLRHGHRDRDSAGRQIRTSLVLLSYARSLRALVSTRVARIGTGGVDVGARPAGELDLQGPPPEVRVEPATRTDGRQAAALAFLAAERRELSAIAAAATDAALQAARGRYDYLTAGYLGVGQAVEQLPARVRIDAAFLATRIDRAIARTTTSGS